MTNTTMSVSCRTPPAFVTGVIARDVVARGSASLLLVGIYLCGGIVPARSDVLDVNVSYDISNGNNVPTQKTLQFSQFNPALGTLTGATLGFAGINQFELQTFPQQSGPFSVSLSGLFSIASLLGTQNNVITGTVVGGDPEAFASPEDLVSFGPASFAPNQFAGLQGTGTVPLTAEVFQTALAVSYSPSSFAASVNDDLSAVATLEYTYTPATSAPPARVAEPLSAIMLVTGVVGLGLVRRKAA